MTMEGFSVPKAPKLELVPTDKELYEKLVNDLAKARQIVTDLENLKKDAEINGTAEEIADIEKRRAHWMGLIEDMTGWAREKNPDYRPTNEEQPQPTIH